MTWRHIIEGALLLFIAWGFIYATFFYGPCICVYSFVQYCPRHGLVRDEDGNSLVEWIK